MNTRAGPASLALRSSVNEQAAVRANTIAHMRCKNLMAFMSTLHPHTNNCWTHPVYFFICDAYAQL